ncbi:MAG: DUF962 domain-containing protein, partial [Thermoanaerobaculia bacterium]
MTMPPASFAEFWPFYCGEHRRPLTRLLHVIGSLGGPLLAAIVCFRTGTLRYLWIYPVVAYGFAWFSHFLVERNRPASFRFPLWSFAADYVMVWKILTGSMPAA